MAPSSEACVCVFFSPFLLRIFSAVHVCVARAQDPARFARAAARASFGGSSAALGPGLPAALSARAAPYVARLAAQLRVGSAEQAELTMWVERGFRL